MRRGGRRSGSVAHFYFRLGGRAVALRGAGARSSGRVARSPRGGFTTAGSRDEGSARVTAVRLMKRTGQGARRRSRRDSGSSPPPPARPENTMNAASKRRAARRSASAAGASTIAVITSTPRRRIRTSWRLRALLARRSLSGPTRRRFALAPKTSARLAGVGGGTA